MSTDAIKIGETYLYKKELGSRGRPFIGQAIWKEGKKVFLRKGNRAEAVTVDRVIRHA